MIDGEDPAEETTSTGDQDVAVPEVPALAASLFGPAVDQVGRYVAMLAGDGVVRGLIGPREVPRLWDRHVLNSAALAEVVPQGSRVVDVGSGAGLPGVPLALARPDLTLTLVEPMARRVEFLQDVVTELGAPWRVIRGRAEERSVVRAVGSVDVVTARAVAPLPRLVGWCRGLLAPGAQLIALVGARAAAEVPGLVPELEAAGMRDVHTRAVGVELGAAATTVVLMTRAGTSRSGRSAG
ncbi:16S rRNA (guanine(527)-N(7))-methyltransferase RsmG [Modestobacter sp. VKM Ac-2984]|uniref:16S rRNA (guanine(527)-N(7))-methyltransferase RsmG n=1 Tax=Modestobacter sp. VKM Ac-2984 TaxID=3004138 RepID=UPI0022AAB1ED|nr:16S rRNA (guanine(527)-N(7))-methyltransferase RsmG [Modestobacter sp. VKM Ac-2984]MCZ2815440.1 16S rRNA (guanine(527)-N(7))-methyltransferase RsmG [Modestobacter sp. VKM Ac-2984]